MEEYKKILGAIGNLLKTEGFSKKGDTFYLLSGGNWGLVNFQKSKESSKTTIKFTINLGIHSAILGKALGGSSSDKPTIEDCHWKKRIGFLLSEKQDYWWVIGDNSMPIEKVIDEISFILREIAVPGLKNHIADESLKQEWLSGLSEGATELQRYIYLTALLKLSNDERFETVAKNFMSFSKGKTYEYTAMEHLKEFGFYGK